MDSGLIHVLTTLNITDIISGLFADQILNLQLHFCRFAVSVPRKKGYFFAVNLHPCYQDQSATTGMQRHRMGWTPGSWSIPFGDASEEEDKIEQ